MGVATVAAPARLSPAELVSRYQAGIWRYLRYLGASESEADDLTQESFLAVLRQSAPFEQRSDGETARYLRTVARNQFLMFLRKAKRQGHVQEFDEADQVWDRFAGATGGDLYLDALDDCLKHMAGRAQQAIEMRYRQGYSREQIGAELGLTDDGVKTLLRRTRDSLRHCVEGKVTGEAE